ncbi:MAG: hypothetical protein ACFFBD_05310, partial [Candidatus Hodarchaeota archaeon]
MSNYSRLTPDFNEIKPRLAENKDAEEIIQLWQKSFKYLLSILSRPPGTLEVTKKKILEDIKTQRIYIWRKSSSEL